MDKTRLFKFFQNESIQDFVNFNEWEAFWLQALRYFREDELSEIKELFDKQGIDCQIGEMFKIMLRPFDDVKFVLFKDTNEKDPLYMILDFIKANIYEYNLTSPLYPHQLQDQLKKFNLLEYNNYDYSKNNNTKEYMINKLIISLGFNKERTALKFKFYGSPVDKNVTSLYFGADSSDFIFRNIPNIGIAYTQKGISDIIDRYEAKLKYLGVIE